MESYLYQAISGATAILLFIVLLRPQTFPFLLDKGTNQPSLGRQGQYTALMVSTWAFVTLTLNDKLTEWFFVGYMLSWAGAQFGSLYLKVKGQQSQPTGAQP